MFSNLDIDPREILRLAELESVLWAEAQIVTDQKRESQVPTRHTLETTRRWCFIDGSWKEKELFGTKMV